MVTIETLQKPASALDRLAADELYNLAAALEAEISTTFDLIAQVEDLQHRLSEQHN